MYGDDKNKEIHEYGVFMLAQGYKICFMLNSAEHESFPLINVKMPTVVGILTFMSRKNSILELSEPEIKAEFLDIFILISI